MCFCGVFYFILLKRWTPLINNTCILFLENVLSSTFIDVLTPVAVGTNSSTPPIGESRRSTYFVEHLIGTRFPVW